MLWDDKKSIHMEAGAYASIDASRVGGEAGEGPRGHKEEKDERRSGWWNERKKGPY